MFSKRVFIALLIITTAGQSFSEHDAEKRSKDSKSRGKERKVATPHYGREVEEMGGACFAGVAGREIDALFKSDDAKKTEKDLKKVHALIQEISRRTADQGVGPVSELFAFAEKAKVKPEKLAAALIRPEVGMDESQIASILEILHNVKPRELNGREVRRNLSEEDQQRAGSASQIEKILGVSLTLGTEIAAMFDATDEHEMRTAMERAQKAAYESDNLNLAGLRVLLSNPKIDFKATGLTDRRPMALKVLGEMMDAEAEEQLVSDLKKVPAIGKKVVPAEIEKLAKQLRAMQRYDFSTAEAYDDGHEMAEELARTAKKHGFLGALPALLSNHNPEFCVFSGAGAVKREHIEEEVGEMIEEVAKGLGYKVDPEKMYDMLRELGEYSPKSDEFKKAARELLSYFGKDAKMSLPEVLQLAGKAGFFLSADREKAFTTMVQAAAQGKGVPPIEWNGQSDNIDVTQPINEQIARIKKEKDLRKLPKLVGDLIDMTTSLNVDTDSVMAHLGSDGFLVNSADPQALAALKGRGITQAVALHGLKPEQRRAIDKIFPIDALGAAGAADGTWLKSFERLEKKAKEDEMIAEALRNLQKNRFFAGPRDEYAAKSVGGMPVGNIADNETPADGEKGTPPKKNLLEDLANGLFGKVKPQPEKNKEGDKEGRETYDRPMNDADKLVEEHASKVMQACTTCHTPGSGLPDLLGDMAVKTPEDKARAIISTLIKKADGKPEKAMEILSRMLGKAEGTTKGMTRQDTRDFIKYVEKELGKQFKIDEAEVDEHRDEELAEMAELAEKEKKDVKTNQPTVAQYVSGLPTPSGLVTSTVGVPNFRLSSDGRVEPKLSTDGKPQALFAVQKGNMPFPAHALVANKGTVGNKPGTYYYFTDANGRPGRNPVQFGQAIRGDFIGLPKTTFVKIENGLDNIPRFVPVTVPGNRLPANTVAGFAARERDEREEEGRLTPLPVEMIQPGGGNGAFVSILKQPVGGNTGAGATGNVGQTGVAGPVTPIAIRRPAPVVRPALEEENRLIRFVPRRQRRR